MTTSIPDDRSIQYNCTTHMYDAYWQDTPVGEAPSQIDADRLIDLYIAVAEACAACPECSEVGPC